MGNLDKHIERNVLRARKASWRIFHDYRPNATPVFILGAQRSGTTMLIECLEKSLEIEVLGESSHAMVNYRIKSDDHIADLIRTSRHRCIVFKPLTDSHRARPLLALAPSSFVIWAFRRVEDRVNSSVAKFGDHNLQILRGLSRGEGFERWQAQGLTDADLAFIRQFDYSNMSPHVASALFWYLRNTLYFHQGLEELENVLPLAYEDMASNPREVIQGVCKFIGVEFKDSMVKSVHAKSIGRNKSQLPDEIVALCAPLYERLHAIQKTRWQSLRLGV